MFVGNAAEAHRNCTTDKRIQMSVLEFGDGPMVTKYTVLLTSGGEAPADQRALCALISTHPERKRSQGLQLHIRLLFIW